MVAIAVVPVAALVAQLTVEERRVNLERARERAERLLDSTMAEQEDILRSGRELAQLLAQLAEIAIGDSERCSALLGKLIAAIPSYEFAARLTANGSVDCSTDPGADSGELRDIARALLDVPQETRSLGYYRSAGSGRPVATILETLPQQRSRQDVFLLVDVKLRWPSQLAAALPARAGNVVVLADASGRDYLRLGPGGSSNGAETQNEALRQMVRGGPAGYVEARGRDGVKRLYVYRRMQAANPLPLYLYIGQPVSVVYSDANEHLRRNALVAAISLLLVSILAWVAADRLVLRDVNALLGATARLAEGDLSARVPVPASSGEIRDLALRFNLLARNLEERRREFLVLGNSSPDTILRVNRKLSIEWANATAVSRIGLDPDALSGKPLVEALPLLGLPGEAREVIDESFATGQVHERELRVGDPPHERWLDVRGVPERARGISAGYVLLLVRDVSERKRLEAHVAQAERLDSIGKLAGAIAHDFNNLLTAIIGNAEAALRALEPEHRARADVTEIRDIGKRAAALVRQLLTFARREPARSRVIDLNRYVEDNLGLLQRIAGRRVQLALELAPEVPNVRFDPTQLEQVLVNLVSNARDAMPEGGTVTLAVKRADSAPGAAAGTGAPAAGYVLLAVSDTGFGIPDGVRERIFEPFFTTKGDRGGTGLGLAVVYGVVRQHGGYIEAKSLPGRGAVFEIYLPGTHEKEVAETADPWSRPPAGGRETIFLVEDRDSVRATIVRHLRSAGYTVEDFRDGAEVIERIERGSLTSPDLVVTDLAMPRLDGEQLVARLKSVWPKVPVLIVTGYDAQASAQRMMEEGLADDLLQKPFESEQLLSAVRQLLDTLSSAV
jgi:signal transduction histidine kinase/ActR/RegA family two-component response regulator/HAMP domain-containing protein